ncbi:MAG: hypothetical protein ACFFDX_15375 [Candidatus Odinarchaeota archaeon]
MKKAYYILFIFVIFELVLYIISIFMPPDVQFVFITLLIAIPIGLIVFSILFTYIYGIHGDPYTAGSADYHRPLIQDKKEFLKAQPFFCGECKTFTDLLLEYCENCGTKDSLRKATKNDFKFYVKRIREDSNP